MMTNNQAITLTHQLGKGGEATVYNLAEQPHVVAKLYHQPAPAHAAKLQAMLINPPEQPKGYISIAWPIALLYQHETRLYSITAPNKGGITHKGEFVGFLMPKATEVVSLFHIYNPAMRAKLAYPFDERALHRTATNLCAVVLALHAKGYVVGDLNESNILVNQQALVTLVDCDSFQVRDEHGKVHRCPVGKPEYTPPELQGISLKEVDQTETHDRFSLGVLLFQLLMSGFHPFTGVLQSGVSVGRVDLFAIRQGLFPYGGNPAMIPPPAAPMLTWLHPALQQAFVACFKEGHQKPERRPSAKEWQRALFEAEQALIPCEAEHLYSNHLPTCPYCERQRVSSKKTDPSTENPWFESFMAGIEAYNNGEAAAVIQHMTTALSFNQEASGAYAYRAWAYYEQQQYQAAVDDARTAVAHNHENVLAYFILGRSYLQTKQYQVAVEAFTEAIEHGYQPVSQAYQQRAVAYQRMGRPIEMARDLAAAVAQGAKEGLLEATGLGGGSTANPKLQETMYKQGLEAYHQNDPQTVVKAMNAVITGGQETTEVYTYRSWGHAEQGQYRLAMTDYWEALKRAKHKIQRPSPDVYQLVFEKGEQAYQQGDAMTVLETMQALVEVHQQARHDDDGTMKEKLTLEPSSRAYRGWAYYQQGNYQAAIEDARFALGRDFLNVPLALYVLGASYNQQKAYPKALLPLIGAAFLKGNKAEIYWERSLAFEKLGLLPLAKYDVERYLAVEHDPQKREVARLRLREIGTWRQRPWQERLKRVISEWRK